MVLWWLLPALASSLLLAHEPGEPVRLFPSQTFPKPAKSSSEDLITKAVAIIGVNICLGFLTLQEVSPSFSGPFTV